MATQTFEKQTKKMKPNETKYGPRMLKTNSTQICLHVPNGSLELFNKYICREQLYLLNDRRQRPGRQRVKQMYLPNDSQEFRGQNGITKHNFTHRINTDNVQDSGEETPIYSPNCDGQEF